MIANATLFSPLNISGRTLAFNDSDPNFLIGGTHITKIDPNPSQTPGYPILVISSIVINS